MEVSTKENEERLYAVYDRVMAEVHAGNPISDDENFIFQVELLSQEANSGASFEQYFRWVGKPELDQILGYVARLGIPEVSEIVEQAFKVAFPNGVPEDEDEYEDCTDWTESQEEQLAALFQRFEEYNGVITNKLGIYILEHGIR